MNLLWDLSRHLPALLIGLLLLAALSGPPRSRAAWLAHLGTGYIVGCLLWGALLRFAPLALDRWNALGWSALLLGGLLLAAVWRWRQASFLEATLSGAERRPERWAMILMLFWLLVLGAALAVQNAQLPTLAWDAWTVWMVRPAAWSAAGAVLPLAEFAPWWQSEPGSVLFAHAAAYPSTLPRLHLWTGMGTDGWSEHRAGLSWMLLWLALGLATYGHLRCLGLRRSYALAASWVLLGLPQLNTHVVLYGYSDLWMGALLGLVLVHCLRAQRFASARDWRTALALTLMLPLVKFEGGVWALCVFGAMALTWLRARSWLRWAIPTALACGALLIGTATPLPVPGLGWVTLEWGAITLPTASGRMELFLRPVSGPVLQSLIALPNWLLLWPTVLALLIWRSWQGWQQRGWMFCACAMLLAGYGFLFLLFFFTDASQWASSMTSLNRLLLQIAPATVVFVALLLTRDRAPYGRYS